MRTSRRGRGTRAAQRGLGRAAIVVRNAAPRKSFTRDYSMVDRRLLIPGAQPHELFARMLERLGYRQHDDAGDPA
jgi:hypothetical protein